MYDELYDGRRIWVLTVVDNFSRVSPGPWVTRHARAIDVVMALHGAVAEFGSPRTIRLDNGSQFTAKELDLCLCQHGRLGLLQARQPTDDADIEAFNSWFSLECLNQHWFLDIEDARAKIEAWCQDYTSLRLHGAIGNRVPMALVKSKKNRILTIQSDPDSRRSGQVDLHQGLAIASGSLMGADLAVLFDSEIKVI